MSHPVVGSIEHAPADGDADAPGALGVIEAFVNTVTYDGDAAPEEGLTDPATLHRWLHDHGLADPDTDLGDTDLDRALAVREALRELLHANHDGVAAPEALAVLQRESDRAPLTVAFAPDGHAALAPGGTGMDRSIGMLLAIVLHAMHDGTWERLKACRNDGCRWAFYDRSRNRSGRWCDMSTCGNRAKVAAYRQRHGET